MIQYKEIDITKLTIIIFIGVAGILAVLYNISDVPALCLGGLIGYLSKDIPVINAGIDEGDR